MSTLDRIIGFYGGAMNGVAYGILAALAAATAFAVVWRFITPARPTASTDGISATELAYLRSDAAPVVTALAGLRARGRITSDGRVDPSVPAGPESDWFTQRVLQRVAADPRHTVRSLIIASRGDLPTLERSLCARGLMRPAAERTRIRLGALPALAVTAMAIAYCVYQLIQLPARSSTWAWVTMIIVIPFALVVLPALFSVDRRTRAGRRLLKVQQKQQEFLRPARRPAFTTYGPASAAVSAALFGTAALWMLDPDYATAVELNGDTDGGGDGASCGGSSCGGDGGGGGGGGGGCGGCGGGGGGCGG
ncbi:TIGR04222 domain-containing membrane protein [Mycobacterium sp. AMU20-3851]|uniref:TIGR04222 domain-containing membrane protein n=1 Tax=Mycobacterium sp. AMU20-3851 TaxID=3122055 RepID=UPI00375492EF